MYDNEDTDMLYDGEDMAVEAPPKPEWWTVAVYDVELGYGGPEEGGWWYDCGSIVDKTPPMHFFTQREAYDAASQLNVVLAIFVNAYRRHYTNTNGDPKRIARVYQGHAPAYFPAKRPHYE